MTWAAVPYESDFGSYAEALAMVGYRSVPGVAASRVWHAEGMEIVLNEDLHERAEPGNGAAASVWQTVRYCAATNNP